MCVKMFEVEKVDNNCMKVHSRNHCEERVILETDDYYARWEKIENHSIINLIKEVQGVYNIEKINPYLLKIRFAKLFSFDEIKEKISNIYWFHNFADDKDRKYNSKIECLKLIQRIINEGNNWAGVSRNKEKCVGCCMYHN